MLNCRKLDLSPRLAVTRIEAARQVFDEATLRRLLAFTLFIIGVNRTRIAEELQLPPGTLRSLIQRVLNDGIEGFADHRRRSTPAMAVPKPEQPPASTVRRSAEANTLVIGGGHLRLPDNPIQRKVLLLSLIDKGMLSVEDVAAVLGLSVSHTRRLHSQLMACDVEAVIDKRRGQLQDYRVGPELKGHMIVQFVLELAECGRASSAAVSQRLQRNCDERVPERTIRDHLSRMGLSDLRESLATGLGALKKTPDIDSGGCGSTRAPNS